MSPPADLPKGNSIQKGVALKGDEEHEQSGAESSDDNELYMKPIHVSARYHADDARFKSLMALPKRATQAAEQGPKSGFVDAFATADQDSSSNNSSSSSSSDPYPNSVAREETSHFGFNKYQESQDGCLDGAASRRRYLWLSRDASDLGNPSEGEPIGSEHTVIRNPILSRDSDTPLEFEVVRELRNPAESSAIGPGQDAVPPTQGSCRPSYMAELLGRLLGMIQGLWQQRDLGGRGRDPSTRSAGQREQGRRASLWNLSLGPEGSRTSGEAELDWKTYTGQDQINPTHWLACPFWKRNPENHPGCIVLRLENAEDVRLHLTQKHLLDCYYCQSCFEAFENDEDYQQHMASESPCPASPGITLPEFMGLQQQAVIDAIPKNANLFEEWLCFWDVLFPGTARPSSPSMNFETREHLDAWVDFCDRRASYLVIDEILESDVGSGLSPSNAARLLPVVQKALRAALQEFIFFPTQESSAGSHGSGSGYDADTEASIDSQPNKAVGMSRARTGSSKGTEVTDKTAAESSNGQNAVPNFSGGPFQGHPRWLGSSEDVSIFIPSGPMNSEISASTQAAVYERARPASHDGLPSNMQGGFPSFWADTPPVVDHDMEAAGTLPGTDDGSVTKRNENVWTSSMDETCEGSQPRRRWTEG